MAVPPPAELVVDEDDLAPVVAELVRLAATGAWINLLPEVVEGEEPPPRNPVVGIFSARGDPVPMATWSGAAGGRRWTLGIEHGWGPKALARLTEVDLGLRDGWLKVSDHARRGLVVTCPASEDPDEVVWWLMTACHALSPVRLTGSWLARVYEP